MTYSEMLKQAKENKIEAGQLMTAQELDDRLNEVGVTLDEKIFNEICEIVYDCWVHLSKAKSVYSVIRVYERQSEKYAIAPVHMREIIGVIGALAEDYEEYES